MNVLNQITYILFRKFSIEYNNFNHQSSRMCVEEN